MMYIPDGAINLPHFYITHAEAQRALFLYTGLTEHPRIPAIDRNLICDPLPSLNATQIPSHSASSASSAALELPAVLTIPTPEASRTGKLSSMSSDVGVNWVCIVVTEDIPEPPAGHLMSVLMNFNSQVAGPVGRGLRLVTKKAKITKSGYIILDGILRTNFVTAFLSFHGLSEQYSPGAQLSKFIGLDLCKFIHWHIKKPSHWSYNSGGKAGATTIDNDQEFAVALAALLKKNPKTCQAGVEFDVNNMDEFRICNRVCQFNVLFCSSLC
jgi:hypothetical protein